MRLFYLAIFSILSSALWTFLAGVPIRDGLEHASELLHCSKMLALDAAMDSSADRHAWVAHYLGEMAKAVVDDLANGILPNGVMEEGELMV
jgi:hypothetical protein